MFCFEQHASLPNMLLVGCSQMLNVKMGYCLLKRSPHCLYDILVSCSILCLFSPQVVEKKPCYCRCYLRVCYCILTSQKLWIWLADLALLIVSRCRHHPQDIPNAIWYKPCKSLKLQKMLNKENWGTADGGDAEKDRLRWGAWWRVMSSRKGASIFFCFKWVCSSFRCRVCAKNTEHELFYRQTHVLDKTDSNFLSSLTHCSAH